MDCSLSWGKLDKKKKIKKKITTQTNSSSKQRNPRAHRQTGPLLPGSSWRGQGARPLCCPSQTDCVLATGAGDGEASYNLQTRAQLSTTPACADNSNTVFSLLGATSKHHPDHPPLSNHLSCTVAQQARIQETVLASTFQSKCWSAISSLLGIGQKSLVPVFTAGKD